MLAEHKLDSAMNEQNAHLWPNKEMETLDIPSESTLFWKKGLARTRRPSEGPKTMSSICLSHAASSSGEVEDSILLSVPFTALAQAS